MRAYAVLYLVGVWTFVSGLSIGRDGDPPTGRQWSLSLVWPLPILASLVTVGLLALLVAKEAARAALSARTTP